MYIGINTVAQIVYMLIIPFFQNNLVLRPAPSLYPEQLNVLFLVSALSFAILSAACYIVTNIILKRKLNLE